MDFELNRNFCDGTPANCADNGKGLRVTPLRVAGDKLISYDLSKGGTVPMISIRTWRDSGVWGPADPISGGANPGAIGSVNSSPIPASEADAIGPTGLDPFTFGEAVISFEALFDGACGSF